MSISIWVKLRRDQLSFRALLQKAYYLQFSQVFRFLQFLCFSIQVYILIDKSYSIYFLQFVSILNIFLIFLIIFSRDQIPVVKWIRSNIRTRVTRIAGQTCTNPNVLDRFLKWMACFREINKKLMILRSRRSGCQMIVLRSSALNIVNPLIWSSSLLMIVWFEQVLLYRQDRIGYLLSARINQLGSFFVEPSVFSSNCSCNPDLGEWLYVSRHCNNQVQSVVILVNIKQKSIGLKI